MDSGLLLHIFVFLAAASLVVPLASRFKLGSILGFMIAGILIGPFGLGLIGDADKAMHFGEFGVIMMLFVIGMELEPERLWRMRKSILGLGGLQLLLCAAVFAVAGIAFGHGWRGSLATGLALALSSTALVLQILQEKNLLKTALGETSFSVLIFQDVAVIPILVLMPLLAGHSASPGELHQPGLISGLPGWAQTLAVAGAVALVILGSRYLSGHLFRAIARTKMREVFTATSLALVVGITLLMLWVGLSPGLGVFLAGLALANSEYRRTVEADIEPFKGLLLGLFFISVGMGMNFALLFEEPLRLLGGLALLLGTKITILFALGRLFGLDTKQNIGFALALSQGGEFAFVLFQFAGGLGLIPREEARFLILLVALSMATTPLLMSLYNRLIVPRFMSRLPDREFDEVSERNPVIIAGFGRFGQVIGRFLLSQRVPVTVLESDPDQVDLLLRFGFKGHYGDVTRLDVLRGAGAEQARLLVVAVEEEEACLEIVRLAKAEFPKLKVFARARNRRHAYELHLAGVDYFKRETFDSALAMAGDIMVLLGGKPEEVRDKAEKFRKHDEATLRQSFEFFEDEPMLIDFTRLSREELDRILTEDAKEA